MSLNNGRPKYINFGIDDQSILPTVISTGDVGQYVGKFFLVTQKGVPGSYSMTSSEALAAFGADTFDPSKEFFNHQTEFCRTAMAKSKVVIEKIDMGGSNADTTLYVDILQVTQSILKRSTDGAVVANADEMAAGVAGYKVRLLSKSGEAVIGDGTMVDGDGNKSTMYPILTLTSESGSYFNDFGIQISESTKAPADFGQFIYDLTYKYSNGGVVGTVKTLFGASVSEGGLLAGLNPITNDSALVSDVFSSNIFNEGGEGATRYQDVKMEVHSANVALVAKKFAEAELAYTSSNLVVDTEGDTVDQSTLFDVTEQDASDLMNIIGLNSSTGVPYYTITRDETADAAEGIVVGNEDTTFFLNGGTDYSSDLDTDEKKETHYEAQVSALLDNYLDPESPYQEVALHPETELVDSGFPLEIKKKLINIIQLRADTTVSLAVHIHNEELTEAEMVAIGAILKSRLNLAPESLRFGTGVARAHISFGKAKHAGSDYKEYVPTSISILEKVVDYMGAGTQEWKEDGGFDAGDESAATELYDIYPKFVPPALKDASWAIGINWVSPLYDDKIYQWEAIATVSDDTSVLNSIFPMYAAAHIMRMEIFAWKKFTGETRYTAGKFKEKVELHLKELIYPKKFDGRFLLSPTVIIDSYDESTGYSWHTETRMGVNNMFTVVRNSIVVVRKNRF